jgi:hypothetical protein
MARKTIKQSLRKQIFDQKVKIWTLYEKMQVQKTIENTNKSKQREIYLDYISTFNYWGGVEFVYWLSAVAKICKKQDSRIDNVAIFPLSRRSESEETKLTKLKVIAKQMGLDVTITKN